MMGERVCHPSLSATLNIHKTTYKNILDNDTFSMRKGLTAASMTVPICARSIKTLLYEFGMKESSDTFEMSWNVKHKSGLLLEI